MLTANDVRKILRQACDRAGSIRAWAKQHELSTPYVSDVLLGRREPGPSILSPFGLEAVRETTYRRAK